MSNPSLKDLIETWANEQGRRLTFLVHPSGGGWWYALKGNKYLCDIGSEYVVLWPSGMALDAAEPDFFEILGRMIL